MTMVVRSPFLFCAGLWEFMSNEECVHMASAASQPRLAVESLITEASDRWMKEEQVYCILMRFVTSARIILMLFKWNMHTLFVCRSWTMPQFVLRS